MAPTLQATAGDASAVVTPSHAQADWAGRPLADRLRVLRRARHQLARKAQELVSAISPELVRTPADTLIAEVLPLLAAGRFLEQNARRILKPNVLGKKGLPFWLTGISHTIERSPLGIVLVIAPANYPLFLPGVQTLQALCAGNSVIWKPGLGGWDVAEVFADAFQFAGLPQGLLRVTEESREAALAEIAAKPDKIFFTGSAHAGRDVLHLAAETVIPVVAELSGCDAVIALPTAHLDHLVDALAFGMRLNGSATCMAPRRLFVLQNDAQLQPLISRLQHRFANMEGVLLRDPVRNHLRELLHAAAGEGANVCGDVRDIFLKPILVLDGTPEMQVARDDIFAPVLTVITVADTDELLRAEEMCPFGLTVSIFGQAKAALELGGKMKVGTVLVNDLIISTADPRVPFGGRRGSGFGVTRGTEGLLEMTVPKVVSIRRSGWKRIYQATSEHHESLFQGAIEMDHAASLATRFSGLRKMTAAAMRLK